VTVAFLMALVWRMATDGAELSCTAARLVIVIVAFGLALASAFVGGDAAARGVLPIAGSQVQPVKFAVSGGVAVFVVGLLAGFATMGAGDHCASTLDVEITAKIVELVDGNERPLDQATLTVDGYDAYGRSNSDGLVSARLQKVTAGRSATVRIARTGYETFAYPYVLSSNSLPLHTVEQTFAYPYVLSSNSLPLHTVELKRRGP
jgi:hypothetical protein